jgi:hypothetical protein
MPSNSGYLFLVVESLLELALGDAGLGLVADGEEPLAGAILPAEPLPVVPAFRSQLPPCDFLTSSQAAMDA